MATDRTHWVGIGRADDGSILRVIVRPLEGSNNELRLSYLLRDRDDPDEVIDSGCDTFELRWPGGCHVEGLDNVAAWLESRRVSDDGNELFYSNGPDLIVREIARGIEVWPRASAITVTVVIDQAFVDLGDDHEKLKPASKAAVEALGKVYINGGECSICWGDFSLKTDALSMPCSHTFHHDCIVRWLSKRSTCPLCRFQLDTIA